jgi:hypothetical protein
MLPVCIHNNRVEHHALDPHAVYRHKWALVQPLESFPKWSTPFLSVCWIYNGQYSNKLVALVIAPRCFLLALLL